jgi:hypothetical protein
VSPDHPRNLLVAAMAALLLAACGASSAKSVAVSSPVALESPSPAVSPLVVVNPACPAGQTVGDVAALKRALATAAPGTVILLAPGTYSGRFSATQSGTASAPITLCGSRDAIVDGGGTKSGYTLYLNGASWWRLIGFSVQGGQKGLVTDHATHVLIWGLYVHDIGDEGIHLRSFSTDNIVEGVTVRNTGLLTAGFGEGIYVGSANKNWCKYAGCNPDASDRNIVRNNDIAQTTAENIDIKEGTTGGLIANNRLSGDGMVASAASAWVNVKGNSWTITGNVGKHSLKDGFQVHRVYTGWGQANVFQSNTAQVDGPGYGFYVQSSSLATVLTCDNTAIGAALGLSNAQCTNG